MKTIMSTVLIVLLTFVFAITALAQQNFDNLKGDNIHEASPDDIRMENGKLSYLIARAKMLGGIADRGPATKETAIEYFNNASERLLAMAAKPMTAEQKIGFNKNLAELKKVYPNIQALGGTMKVEISAIDSAAVGNKPATAAAPSGSATLPSPPTSAAPETSTATPATASAPASASAPTTDSSSQSATQPKQCLMAGFFIYKQECKAFTRLPDNFELREVSVPNFKCDPKDGDYLCNPRIFGYKNSETGYCTNNNEDMTETCSRKSNNKENITRMINIWNNPANAETNNKYVSNIKIVCDKSFPKSVEFSRSCAIISSQIENLKAAVDVKNKVEATRKSLNQNTDVDKGGRGFVREATPTKKPASAAALPAVARPKVPASAPAASTPSTTTTTPINRRSIN